MHLKIYSERKVRIFWCGDFLLFWIKNWRLRYDEAYFYVFLCVSTHSYVCFKFCKLSKFLALSGPSRV